jgi:hypothetical protein
LNDEIADNDNSLVMITGTVFISPYEVDQGLNMGLDWISDYMKTKADGWADVRGFSSRLGIFLVAL